MTTFDRDYWVDVTVEGETYELGADLYDHGRYESFSDALEVGKDPEFFNYLVFNSQGDGPLTTDCLPFYDIKRAAQEHLCNVYWNEVSG